MAGARELKKPKNEKRGLFVPIAAAAVAAVIVGYLGLCAWVGSAGVMPNTTLGGLDVSGMDAQQAQATVEQALEKHGSKASVTLTYGDWSGTITADQMQTFGLDGGLATWRVGRDSFLTQGYQYIRHMLLGQGLDVALDLGYEGVAQQELEQLLDQAEQAIGCEVSRASYELQGDKLVMTKGKTGLAINREDAKDSVYQAFYQDVLPEAFQGVESNKVVELVLTETAAEQPDFNAIRAQLCVQPKNAAIDPETYEVIPHVDGVEFDAAVLRTAYEQAEEGETFSIPVAVTQPEETTESLQAKLFADLLGEGVTKVGGTANRKTNVKLSAEACNGIVLMPGEIFAYNETTGSRTADKGYLPAPIYVGGKSEDDIGGGICQTSSTIYYAVLHTTLEIVERHAHQFATGYVPDGMDATVFFGALDFRFKNSTNYPIKIVTESYDQSGSRYLKVKIFGTNEDGRYAKPERVQYDWVQPTDTYQPDESIPRGTVELDKQQNSYIGRKADTFRYIYEKDGTLVEKQQLGTSNYKMRPNLYHYNPQDGDPATWVNGMPPQPEVEQPSQTTPTQPEEGSTVQQPEQTPSEGTQTPPEVTVPEDPYAHLKPGELPPGL